MVANIGGGGAVTETGIADSLMVLYAEVKVDIDEEKQVDFPLEYIFAKDTVVRNNDFTNLNQIYVNQNSFTCFFEDGEVIDEKDKQKVYSCEGWKDSQVVMFEQAVILFRHLNGNGNYDIYLTYPVKEYEISAGFNSDDSVHGGVHSGVDFVATGDENVYASQSGTVINTYEDCPQNEGIGSTCPTNSQITGGGNYVQLEHKTDGGLTYYTSYHHLLSTSVEVGDKVEQGDKVGVEGSSGNSTGKHVHFELRINENTQSNAVDPMPYFRAEVVGNHKEMMKQAGIKESDYDYVDYIIEHESSWNQYATNKDTGAYGLCQALPASKMNSAGSDWQTNPITQLKWCDSYAKERYGSWKKSYEFWQDNHWW